MWNQTSSLSDFFLFKNVSVHCANLIHVDNFSGLEKSKIKESSRNICVEETSKPVASRSSENYARGCLLR